MQVLTLHTFPKVIVTEIVTKMKNINQLVLMIITERLELHPDVSSIFFHHDQLGFHFERFDGRRYVPNAGKRCHFPDDEAFALNLTTK